MEPVDIKHLTALLRERFNGARFVDQPATRELLDDLRLAALSFFQTQQHELDYYCITLEDVERDLIVRLKRLPTGNSRAEVSFHDATECERIRVNLPARNGCSRLSMVIDLNRYSTAVRIPTLRTDLRNTFARALAQYVAETGDLQRSIIDIDMLDIVTSCSTVVDRDGGHSMISPQLLKYLRDDGIMEVWFTLQRDTVDADAWYLDDALVRGGQPLFTTPTEKHP
jgi:hypothetical protein